MDILDIIDKKEKRETLTKEELQYVIDGYLNGSIKDYQMSALLTEIDLLGLSEEELKRNGKYPFFADQIRGLQIACCLQRVDEVNNWQDEETKTNVKNMMFSTMLEKYGTLDGIDTGLLSSKTGFRIMDEYNDYVNDQKGRKR